MPSLLAWANLVGVLAVQVTLIIAVAALACCFTREAKRKRAFLQAALVAIALLLAFQFIGLRDWVGNMWQGNQSTVAPSRVSIVASQRVSGIADGWNLSRPDQTALAYPVKWPAWVWISGAFLLLCFHGTTRALLLMESRRMPVSELQGEMQHLFSTIGISRIRVRIWHRIKGPAAFGILRPTIAVPPDFARRFSRKQQEAMLAHEAGHLIQRDPVWFVVADIVCAVLWWHPLVWWMRRSFNTACEAAADEASAALPGGAIILAESLIVFGRELSSRGCGNRLGIGGMGSVSELRGRVEALLETDLHWQRLSMAWRLLPKVGAACLAIGFVALPWQSAFPRSGFEILAGCMDQSPKDTNASPNGSLEPAERSAERNGNERRSGVLLIEFAAVPDAHAAALEKLFVNQDKAETMFPAGHVENLLSTSNQPNLKNAIASRSSTHNQIAFLKAGRSAQLRKSLRSQPGVNWRSASEKGTLVKPGHEAYDAVLDVMAVASDVDISNGTQTNQTASVDYKVAEVTTGPEARVLTQFSKGHWRLEISARCVDFLGYEEPPPSGSVVAWASPGEPKPEPLSYAIPVPHFSVQEVQGTATVSPSQTIVLRGPRKADLKGRSAGSKENKEHVAKESRFYVFVSLAPGNGAKN